MLSTQKLTTAHYRRVKSIYKSSFWGDSYDFWECWKSSQCPTNNKQSLAFYFNGECVGFAFVHAWKGNLYLANIAIDEKRRGLGIGTKALKIMMQLALKENCRLTLYPLCAELWPWYQRHGFFRNAANGEFSRHIKHTRKNNTNTL